MIELLIPTTTNEEAWTPLQREEYYAHLALAFALHRAQSAFVAMEHFESVADQRYPDLEFKRRMALAAVKTANGRVSEFSAGFHIATVGLALTHSLIETWAGQITKKGDVRPSQWPFDDPGVRALLADTEKRRRLTDYRNAVFHVDNVPTFVQQKFLATDHEENHKWALDVLYAIGDYLTAFFARWRQAGAIPTEDDV